MLALHNVSKVVGHGTRRRLVLDNISWEIPPRAKIAVLGHVGSGESVLLALLSGADVPTTGWVERRGVVSPTFAFSRQGKGPTTPRQLIGRLSTLFRYDPVELATFVGSIAHLRRDMDIPISKLTPSIRNKLNVALTYGVPCDYYLFNRRIGFGPPEMQQAARKAFELRCEHAGVILATNIVKEARAWAVRAPYFIAAGSSCSTMSRRPSNSSPESSPMLPSWKAIGPRIHPTRRISNSEDSAAARLSPGRGVRATPPVCPLALMTVNTKLLFRRAPFHVDVPQRPGPDHPRPPAGDQKGLEIALVRIAQGLGHLPLVVESPPGNNPAGGRQHI